MKDVNKMILVGRLGADPILRETKNGNPVVQFSVATSYRVRQEGDPEGTATGEETQWHKVVSWGKLGELCAQYLKKGRAVYVEGTVRSHKYTNKEGAERLAFEVIAENVVFLGNSSGASATHGTVLDEAVASA